MASVNKAIIVGNLGRDPEVRTLENGGKFCNLRVATSETWKDRNTGERREKTEWHSVSIFDEKLADLAEKYLHKGSQVYLEGQIETRKWMDQDGKDRYSTEIVLRPFKSVMTFLDAPGERQSGSSSGHDEFSGGRGAGRQDGRQRGGYAAGGAKRPASVDLDDDSIPFAPEVR